MSHIGNNVLFVSWLITWKSELGALTPPCCQTGRNESGEGGWWAAYSGGGFVPEQHLQTVTATCVSRYINKPKQNAAFSEATGSGKRNVSLLLHSTLNKSTLISLWAGFSWLCFTASSLPIQMKTQDEMLSKPTHFYSTQNPKSASQGFNTLYSISPPLLDRPRDLMRTAFFSESSQLYIALESQRLLTVCTAEHAWCPEAVNLSHRPHRESDVAEGTWKRGWSKSKDKQLTAADTDITTDTENTWEWWWRIREIKWFFFFLHLKCSWILTEIDQKNNSKVAICKKKSVEYN